MKSLFKKDDVLYRQWARDFVKAYPKESDQLLHCNDWFFEKAAYEGYCIRYDDAPYEFWDYVVECGAGIFD